MPVAITGFAQALARCLDFEGVDPSKIEDILATANESLEMMYAEPCVEPPILRSGTKFNHLLFVQSGRIVPWTYPPSELDAPFLIGVHEFLAQSERWIGSYSVAEEAVVVTIPVEAMNLIVEGIPSVKDRMHQLVMRRLARFYWTSLATSGTPPSRVAAALVSRLALEAEDYGKHKTINIKQKDLGRLTTMSRSAVAAGIASLSESNTINLGDDLPVRFSGVVQVPDVDLLKYHAFSEVRTRATHTK